MSAEVEKNHLPSEQHARRFLEFIEDGGRGTLKWEKLTMEDRETIEKGLEHLRPAFDELCGSFIEPLRETKPSLFVDHGYSQLWSLIGWAWAIGSRSHVSDSAPEDPNVQKKVTSIKNSEIAKNDRKTKYAAERAATQKILMADLAISADAAEKELIEHGYNPIPPTLTGEAVHKSRQAFSMRLSRAKNRLSQ